MFKCRNDQEGSVLSKNSAIGDRKSDVCEEGKDVTEMEELEHTKLLII